MRIALAQLNPTIGDISGNIGKIRQTVEKAWRTGAGLVIFPELSVTGYPPRDLLCREDFLDRVKRALQEDIAPLSNGMAILIGAPVRGREAPGERRSTEADFLFNAALLYAGGKLAGRQDKTLLPILTCLMKAGISSRPRTRRRCSWRNCAWD